MAVNADRGYDIDGTLNIGGVSFYTGATPPYDIPLDNAVAESIYIQSNGTLWRKIGTGFLEADWTVVVTLPVVITVTDDYTVAIGIGLVRVKATNEDIIITIPSAAIERVLTIKFVLNPNDKYNIWIETADSSLIEDEENALVQCKGTSVTLWANGTDWEIT